MFPVSQTFLDELRAGYKQDVTAELWFNGSFIQTLPVSDGTVTVNRSASIRRTCELTIPDPSFVPQYANSPLSPYGAELHVSSGILYPDGSKELCPLGVFRIDSVDWDEASGAIPHVSCSDRSATLTDAKLIIPRDLGGHGAIDAIFKLVTEIIDVDVNVDLSLVDVLLPGGTIYDTDRWGTIQKIASALGADVFFDVFGNLVIIAVPAITQFTTAGDANWTVDAGENGVLVSAQRGVSRDNVRNCVVVTGGATSNSGGISPVGYAVDDDPRSPTYFGPLTSVPNGPFTKTVFGQSVERIPMAELYTPTQCQASAQGYLANFLGFAKSLSFECVSNPALDGGDILSVVYPSGESELHILDQFELPLAEGSFSASTRTLTYQPGG